MVISDEYCVPVAAGARVLKVNAGSWPTLCRSLSKDLCALDSDCIMEEKMMVHGHQAESTSPIDRNIKFDGYIVPTLTFESHQQYY